MTNVTYRMLSSGGQISDNMKSGYNLGTVECCKFEKSAGVISNHMINRVICRARRDSNPRPPGSKPDTLSS